MKLENVLMLHKINSNAVFWTTTVTTTTMTMMAITVAAAADCDDF